MQSYSSLHLLKDYEAFELWSFSLIVGYGGRPSALQLNGIHDKASDESSVYLDGNKVTSIKGNGSSGFKANIISGLNEIKSGIAVTMVAATLATAAHSTEYMAKNERAINVGQSIDITPSEKADSAIQLGILSALAINDNKVIPTTSGSGKISDIDILVNVHKNGKCQESSIKGLEDIMNKKYGASLEQEVHGAIIGMSSVENLYATTFMRGGGKGNVVYLGISEDLYRAIEEDPTNGKRLIEAIAGHEISHARNHFTEAGAAVVQSYSEPVDPTSHVAKILALDVIQMDYNIQSMAEKSMTSISHTNDPYEKIHKDALAIVTQQKNSIAMDSLRLSNHPSPDLVKKYSDLFSKDRVANSQSKWVNSCEYSSVVMNGLKKFEDGARPAQSASGYLVNLSSGLKEAGYSANEIKDYMKVLILKDIVSARVDAESGAIPIKESYTKAEENEYFSVLNGVSNSIDARVDASFNNKNINDTPDGWLGFKAKVADVFSNPKEGYMPGAPKL